MGGLECLVLGGVVTWLLLVGAVVVAWLLGYTAGRRL